MLDYAGLKAVAAVARTGSFEKAARALHVTPSAISQRVKQLEDRLGAVLVVRGSPCTATEKGEWLCRHVEQVEMLEGRLFDHLPSLGPAAGLGGQVTVHIATNADSLGTWFLPAVAAFTRQTGHLLNIAVDDQDHTAEWLKGGRVLAAVTGLEKPVPGCRRVFLGLLRYHATASPDFIATYFPDGVTEAGLARAPALTFNQKDRLQSLWMKQALQRDVAFPTHWLPSTQGFVEAALLGMGWGMNPVALVKDHLEAGTLVELLPGVTVDIPLYWQVNRLAADQLRALTQAVTAAARIGLQT